MDCDFRSIKKWPPAEDEVDSTEQTAEYNRRHRRTINDRRFGSNICVAHMATYHGKYSEDMKEVRDAMSKSYSWLTGMYVLIISLLLFIDYMLKKKFSSL